MDGASSNGDASGGGDSLFGDGFGDRVYADGEVAVRGEDHVLRQFSESMIPHGASEPPVCSMAVEVLEGN